MTANLLHLSQPSAWKAVVSELNKRPVSVGTVRDQVPRSVAPSLKRSRSFNKYSGGGGARPIASDETGSGSSRDTDIVVEVDIRGLASFVARTNKSVVLDAIAEKAAQAPALFPRPFPLLLSGRNGSITLSQSQIACLLANAFFGILPKQARGLSRNMQHLDFGSLFPAWITSGPVDAKLASLFHYFNTILDRPGPGNKVTFTRRCLSPGEFPYWRDCDARVCDIQTFPKGTIEDYDVAHDSGQECLQVDFANKLIGGGVLEQGAVQEEILFTIFPELLASLFFCEEMKDNECIFISGPERFSTYSGYSKTFQWTGEFEDMACCDPKGRRKREFVAIDASQFRRGSTDTQFEESCIMRELNKAYCGFLVSHQSPFESPAPIATGNWGCGAFNGNGELKALIQIMAASAARRELRYFTFNDEALALKLVRLVEVLQLTGFTVGMLFNVVAGYRRSSNGESVIDNVMNQASLLL
ncbi:hypothetical protein BC830DRAFT_1174897 [Chytriomyces sp. MP71]|nr:hypothetical protein BC830DRAFT_1174897 [Chytriomyces sp. MP71]